MVTLEQQQKLLKAKVAIMLYNLLGRVPEGEEINHAFRLIRGMYKAGHSLHTRA